ncbi:MAG: hypothetical protein GF329_17735 [Candidatus Lokiarchaeota archaeon]|nr:hypothetical protein [Candidatus Lokiarchaeota archaeon]
MPKRKELFSEFRRWAPDLKKQGILTRFQEVRIISPYTSQVCSEHLARGHGIKKTRKKGAPYDRFECTDKSCRYSGNRHANSARIQALLLKYQIDAELLNYLLPFPLSTV